MTTETDTPIRIDSLAFAALPALGAALAEGLFAGVTTRKDGTHAAVVLLPNKAQEGMTWADAMTWASEAGGELPARPIAALLYANAKGEFERAWYWTSDVLDADTGDASHDRLAWITYFDYGYQFINHKASNGLARAVRLIPLKA
jgi:hypothetical protein